MRAGPGRRRSDPESRSVKKKRNSIVRGLSVEIVCGRRRRVERIIRKTDAQRSCDIGGLR